MIGSKINKTNPFNIGTNWIKGKDLREDYSKAAQASENLGIQQTQGLDIQDKVTPSEELKEISKSGADKYNVSGIVNGFSELSNQVNNMEKVQNSNVVNGVEEFSKVNEINTKSNIASKINSIGESGNTEKMSNASEVGAKNESSKGIEINDILEKDCRKVIDELEKNRELDDKNPNAAATAVSQNSSIKPAQVPKDKTVQGISNSSITRNMDSNHNKSKPVSKSNKSSSQSKQGSRGKGKNDTVGKLVEDYKKAIKDKMPVKKEVHNLVKLTLEKVGIDLEDIKQESK